MIIEPVSSQQQASTVSKISPCQAGQEIDETPSLTRFVANIKVLSLANRARIDPVLIFVWVGVEQSLLPLACRTNHLTIVPRRTGLALSKTITASKEDLHDSMTTCLAFQPSKALWNIDTFPEARARPRGALRTARRSATAKIIWLRIDQTWDPTPSLLR